MTFRIERDSLDRSSSVIRLSGDVDLYAAPELKRLMFEAIQAGNTDLICDLSEVTFIDSTALGVMIQARKRLEPGGGSVRVACPDPAIADVFELVGLDRMVPVHGSLSIAIAAVRPRLHEAAPQLPKRSRMRSWLRGLPARGNPA